MSTQQPSQGGSGQPSPEDVRRILTKPLDPKAAARHEDAKQEAREQARRYWAARTPEEREAERERRQARRNYWKERGVSEPDDDDDVLGPREPDLEAIRQRE